MTVDGANWIQLQGAVNARDVGGLRTADGQPIRTGVLIRSASLGHLTDADVRHLVGDLGVRRVVDLRTDIEVDRDGPGALHDQPDVVVHHLSLYPDTLDVTDRAELPAGPRQDRTDPLPWQGERLATGHSPVVAAYLRYLEQRPDSVVAALRAIAEPDGATLVHCAAGKDRTGMVVALALAVAGVPREVIAADYAHTQSQIEAIVGHLARSDLYGFEVGQPDKIPPASAAVMVAVLEAIDSDLGGVLGWLARHGWTAADTDRLRAKLLDEPAGG
ncbi:tyrosine-protein phosphatase [Jatrophihabitans sp.]|uniref:tyrosine-protein phosphatase n=1 Tax=Jatrophihabitans sp. TaxID=1932789 RepID=UPI002C197846|nr:tyrosine-protein phosphatase [Jatrophihabitans sp.]